MIKDYKNWEKDLGTTTIEEAKIVIKDAKDGEGKITLKSKGENNFTMRIKKDMLVLDVNERLTPSGESAVGSFLTQQNLMNPDFSFVYTAKLKRGGKIQVISFAMVPAVEGKVFIHESEYQNTTVKSGISTILAAEPEVEAGEEEDADATDAGETIDASSYESNTIYVMFKDILPLKKGDGYASRKTDDVKGKIKIVQALLKALGGDVGRIDGGFGPKSIKAAGTILGKDAMTDADVDSFILDANAAGSLVVKADEKSITDSSLTAMVPSASSSTSNSTPNSTEAIPTPTADQGVKIVWN